MCKSPAPESFAATAGGDARTEVALSWSARAGVDKYEVGWRLRDTDSWEVVEITGTSLRVTGLECGRNGYRFKVSAYGDGTVYKDVYGDPAKIRGVNTAACSLPGKMDAPDVEAAADGLSVEWGLPSDTGGAPIVEYGVRYRRTLLSNGQPGDWNAVVGVGSATAVEIMGLRPNLDYDVQVRAKNSRKKNWGPWSDSGTATTALAVAPFPKQFGVTRITATEVTVGWKKIDRVSSYRVRYREVHSSAWTEKVHLPSGHKTAAETLSGLSSGKTYEFQVSSHGASDGVRYTAALGAVVSFRRGSHGAAAFITATERDND